MLIDKDIENLNLENNEEIIVVSKDHDNHALFLLISIVALPCALAFTDNSEYYIYFRIIAICWMTFPAIFLTEITIRRKRTRNYITSHRIIKMRGKGILIRKTKLFQIPLQTLEFLDDSCDIFKFVETKNSGELYYSNNDRRYIPMNRITSQTVYFLLDNKKYQTIRTQIRTFLIKTIPLLPHEYIPHLYIKSNS